MAGEIELSGPDLGVDGIPLAEITSDLPVVGHYEGKPVVLAMTASGPCAVGGKCTHYGAPLADGLLRRRGDPLSLAPRRIRHDHRCAGGRTGAQLDTRL